eukprot:TRINITY_DN2871_c0_g1_i1.p1 TRINITY_DN2871_c0_g1~~TRINITY_DN2871_c0_g1_i1.p1  ORF type:complete len:398 (-),score=49.02 TRINITY_DN2871_c0_g1_i1:814-2007(-)
MTEPKSEEIKMKEQEFEGVEKIRLSILKETRPSLLPRSQAEQETQEHYEGVLLSAVDKGDLNLFKQATTKYGKSLRDVRNTEGETLLHICIKSGQNEIFDYLLEHLEKELADQQALANWVDQRIGKNRLAPLHLAAFYGNLHVLKKLVFLGAKPDVRTRSGLTTAHMAAQSNQPVPLIFLKESRVNMSLCVKDKEGNSPLHWACKCGAVSAALFLLKYYNQKEINEGNKIGQTALHFAVESSISTDDTTILKVMLFAGANRNATDKRGRTPADYILELQEKNGTEEGTARDVTRLLQNPKECECLMIRRPIKKTLPSYKLVVVFFFALTGNFLVNTFISIPRTFTRLLKAHPVLSPMYLPIRFIGSMWPCISLLRFCMNWLQSAIPVPSKETTPSPF